MCAQSLSCVRLFVNPWTVAHQVPLPLGFSRQEYSSGLPFLSPGDLPNPGWNQHFLHWQADSLPRSNLVSTQLPFDVVQLLSRVRPFETPWTAARQASLSFTTSWSLLKPMSIESVLPSNHLVLCHPLLLPLVFPSIRVFSNKVALHIR